MADLKENNKIRIYSFYYKETRIPVSNEMYIPVMAGNYSKHLSGNFVGDDTGESISEKNDYYSELTGLYWVWKNTEQKITGSCHYRRYFTAKKYPLKYRIEKLFLSGTWFHKKRKGIIYTRKIDRFRDNILNETEITEIMQTYNVILPQKREFKYSIKEHYRRYHDLDDLKIIEDLIRSKFPEYLVAFNKTLNSNWLYTNNMFIMYHKEFNRLMNWLFTILFEFENRINIQNYTGYQKRVFGFLSERLITVWINRQNLKIKELPVIYFKKLKYSPL